MPQQVRSHILVKEADYPQIDVHPLLIISHGYDRVMVDSMLGAMENVRYLSAHHYYP